MEIQQLFAQVELSDFLRGKLNSVADNVRGIPRDQFMNAPVEQLVESVVVRMTVEPITLHLEQAHWEFGETKMDVTKSSLYNPFRDSGPVIVKATSVMITYPYTGQSGLWYVRPSSSPFDRAYGALKIGDELSGNLIIYLRQPSSQPNEHFKAAMDEQLSLVRRYLEYQRVEVQSYNQHLLTKVITEVQERRGLIQRSENLSDILGIPLERRPDAPSVEPIKLTRRLVRPLPPSPVGGYQPEPGIEEKEYQHILSVIRHEGRTFEATPKTYKVHDEEELRDILLAHLNGHYQGEATGETFRGKGKTDIRIEDNNRAAFIAECKVWKGSGEFKSAVDQLLGYLTWRDCKTALVIFNKHNAKFSGIIDTIPKILDTHPLHQTTTTLQERGELHCRMTSAEDPGRQLEVRVFVFNLYVR